MFRALAGSRFETVVAMILRGGARPESRGVEGVTGCSGEGLHPSTWTMKPHLKMIFFSQRSKSEVVVVCVFSDRMTWRLPMVFSLPRRRLDSDVSSLCSSVACAFSGRAHCQAPRQFECVFSDRLNVVARARGWRASFLIASTHRVTGIANVFFLTVCTSLVPWPCREKWFRDPF